MEKHLIRRICNRIFALLTPLLILASCSDDTIINEIDIYEDGPNLVVTPKNLNFLTRGETKVLDLTSNVEPEELSFEIPANARQWLGAKIVDVVTRSGDYTKKFEVTVQPAGFESKRASVITVTGKGKKQVINIEQLGWGNEVEVNNDIQHFASNATANNEQWDLVEGVDEDGNPVMIPGTDHRPATNAIDGNRGTFYHVEFGVTVQDHPDPGKRWPIVLDVEFDTPPAQIDYINLVPRQDNGTRWGMIGEFNLYVATRENPTLTKINETPFDAGQKDLVAYKLVLSEPLKNVTDLRLEVLSGYNSRVSLGEIEFFQYGEEGDFDYLTIFTDKSASEIKAGVTQTDIEAIPEPFFRVLADAIFNNTYDDTGFRIQTYRPYQDPKIMADINLIEAYSVKDNPMGIYAKEGDVLHIFLDDTKKRDIMLNIDRYRVASADPGHSSASFVLTEGLNVVTAPHDGLLYLRYLVNDELALVPKSDAQKKLIEEMSVKVNVVGGSVNGYFDTNKHTTADWNRIIAYESGAQVFDYMGERIHICWAKEVVKQGMKNPDKVIGEWDMVLENEFGLLGFDKYAQDGSLATGDKEDRKPRNRMFIHVNPGNPGASSSKITFPSGAGFDGLFYDEAIMEDRIWGPAHEIGHMNQMRPAFNWGGMIETTNNIFCVKIQHDLGKQTRLEAENYYASAKRRIMDDYESAPEPKPLNMPFSGYTGLGLDDAGHFEKVVPFWQLFLYCKVNGYEDFYPDLFEAYRQMGLDKLPGFTGTGKNDGGNNVKDHGVLQTVFAVQACKISGMDLREFFVKWGFLREADCEWIDYNFRIFKVTKERLAEVDAEIEALNLPKPTVSLWEINDQNYTNYTDAAFANRKSVVKLK